RVDLRRELVGHEHHHDVCFSRSLSNRKHLVSCVLGLLPRSAAATQTNSDIAAGVFEIASLRETLASVADYGDLFLAYEIKISVFVVVDVHVCLLCCLCLRVFACRESVDCDVARASDVCDADRPQQLDERVDLFFIPGRFDDELCVRDVDNLRAKHAYETQHFLTLCS